MRMCARLLVLAGLCVSAPLAAEEPAGEAERTVRSKAHFDRGRAAFNLGEYEEAMKEFEEGYRWRPMPLFLYNIAQSAERAGHEEKALERYQRYLVVSPRAPERREVLRQIGELKKKLAALPSRVTTPPPLEEKPRPRPPVVEEKPIVVSPPPIEDKPAPAPEPPLPIAVPRVAPPPTDPAPSTAVATPAPAAPVAPKRALAPARSRRWVLWTGLAAGAFAVAAGVITVGVIFGRPAPEPILAPASLQ